MDILQIAKMTEAEARELLEGIRWPERAYCPHCESDDVTKLGGEKHRDGVFQCNNAECREQFTVTVGTIMHKSKLPLVTWVLAFHLICSAKKGVSALQLKRQLGLGSYKTAWHLCHRIRWAMQNGEMPGLLGSNGGVVEIDETYVGGKRRRGEPARKRGRGTPKTPVVALVDRAGKVYSKPLERVDGVTLRETALRVVDRSASVFTDELSSYSGIGFYFKGGHETVNHSADEFSRGRVHVNTAESYFALIKRGIIGSFHHVSKEHLHRYCAEFDFRWNHRKVTDWQRTLVALSRGDGCRLTYEPTKEGLRVGCDG